MKDNETPALQSLKGATVTRADAIHDYTQLAFGDEAELSIYNDWHIAPEATALLGLVGKVLVSIGISTKSAAFVFSDGTRLTVDLCKAAYHGPEALQLNRRGLPTVIWN
jgi:hypothetical protein